MNQVIASSPQELAQPSMGFRDPRLEEMLFRYRGRHYPQTLDQEDQIVWMQYCKDRLTGVLHNDDRVLTFKNYDAAMDEARLVAGDDMDKHMLLQQLAEYNQQLQRELL